MAIGACRMLKRTDDFTMKTKMNKPWVWAMAGFIVLAVLHQDGWNWDDGDLVFGIMPVGLAYHAAYFSTG